MDLSGFGFGHAHCCKQESDKTKCMANGVYFDEKTHYEPSYLELHSFHKNLVWSTRLRRLVFHNEFLTLTIPDLNLETPIIAKKDVRQRFKNKCIVNNVGPDKTARYEPSHLDLHSLHRYLFCVLFCRNETVKKIFSYKQQDETEANRKKEHDKIINRNND